jgi:hypothetical protein
MRIRDSPNAKVYREKVRAKKNVHKFTALQPLNETMQSQGFPVNVPGLNYTVSAPVPEEARTTDSVSFTSSGVVLLHRSPQPFTVSYSVSGQLLNPQPLPP